MNAIFRAAAIVSIVVGTLSSRANAAVVFSDNFNSYAYELNWAPPTSWVVTGGGAVDLIGQTASTTEYNLYAGNGGYVDLDGSNGSPGSLQTNITFLPGTYTLSFALGGSARGDLQNTTVISLGSFSRSITLASSDPLQQYSLSFTTTGGVLSFADLADENGIEGNILDNVVLASAVPEPSTWAMIILGFAGVGYMTYRRGKTAALAA
jgi:hypothetical protein